MKLVILLTLVIVALLACGDVDAAKAKPKPKPRCFSCVPVPRCRIAVHCKRTSRACFISGRRCAPFVFSFFFRCVANAKRAFAIRKKTCLKIKNKVARTKCLKGAVLKLKATVGTCKRNFPGQRKKYYAALKAKFEKCKKACNAKKNAKAKALCLKQCQSVYLKNLRRRFCFPKRRCYYKKISCGTRKVCKVGKRCRPIKCPK